MSQEANSKYQKLHDVRYRPFEWYYYAKKITTNFNPSCPWMLTEMKVFPIQKKMAISGSLWVHSKEKETVPNKTVCPILAQSESKKPE